MKEILKKGDKFGRLTAIKFVKRSKQGSQFWLFKCDCGNEKVILVNNVKRKLVKSCGCYKKEKLTKHGMVETRTYKSWEAMKTRCLDKNAPNYKNYGGRGITVCDKWMKFENFYTDMGKRPEEKSLDRIENNKGYYKKNCKWSTQKEQNNNKRNNILITFNGKTQNMKQWAEELNISYETLINRAKKGWDTETIFFKRKYKHFDNNELLESPSENKIVLS